MSFFSMLRGLACFRSRCLGVHFYNKPIIHQSSVVRYLLLVYPWTSAIRSVSLILWVVPGIAPTRAINHRIVFPIKIKWEMLRCALWMPVVMFTAAALTPGQTCTTWARHYSSRVTCFPVNEVFHRVTMRTDHTGLQKKWCYRFITAPLDRQ